MPITEQVVLTIITAVVAPVLLGILGILTVRSKNRALILKNQAEADKERVEAENKKITAEADRIKSEAEAKLAKEKGDISQIQMVTEMLKQQVTINQQLAQQSADDREKWRSELRDKEKRDESNYRVLANTLRDVGTMMITEVQTKNEQLTNHITKMHEGTRGVMHWEMVDAVATSQKQYAQRDIVKLIGKEEGIPFPPEQGYIFRKCVVRVKPKSGTDLYPAPLHMDQKPVGRIFDGDEVWIISDMPFPAGWSAVRAQDLGVNGWVYNGFISVEDCASGVMPTPA